MGSRMESGKIRLGLIQAATGPDPEKNLEKACRMVKDALLRGANVVCLQEIFTLPYFPHERGVSVEQFAETIPGLITRTLGDLAREYGAVIVAPVFEKVAAGRHYNSAVIIKPDGTTGTVYRKVHIPQDPHYYEKEYFSPGSEYVVENTPFGRIAVLICYDQWFPEPARIVALRGAQIIVYPTALGYIRDLGDPCEGDWKKAWRTVQQGHAIANGIHVAAINRVGDEGDLRFFGGSFICDAFGNLVAEAGDSEEILIADIDLSMNEMVREGWGFLKNRRPETYGNIVSARYSPAGDTPKECGFRMPAEWEPHQGIWLSWPYGNGTFFDLSSVEHSYLEMIRALQGRERIFLLVRDPRMRDKVKGFLADGGIDLRQVRFFLHPYADVWFRDYGPVFLVHTRSPAIAMVDWEFNAWGGKYPELAADSIIPSVIGDILNIAQFSPGIVMEGGSIDVDGCGSLMTTAQCLLHPNRNPTRGKEEIEKILGDTLGVDRFIWLKGGIAGDDTDGHVDDVARFIDPRTVVCALENDRNSENYTVLMENYEILRRTPAYDGSPLRVIPLPMPAAFDDPVPASYTNFYIANGVVLAPTFGDPADERALGILREVFLGRIVRGIDCREMIRGMGAIHCVSQQFPSL